MFFFNLHTESYLKIFKIEQRIFELQSRIKRAILFFTRQAWRQYKYDYIRENINHNKYFKETDKISVLISIKKDNFIKLMVEFKLSEKKNSYSITFFVNKKQLNLTEINMPICQFMAFAIVWIDFRINNKDFLVRYQTETIDSETANRQITIVKQNLIGSNFRISKLLITHLHTFYEGFCLLLVFFLHVNFP